MDELIDYKCIRLICIVMNKPKNPSSCLLNYRRKNADIDNNDNFLLSGFQDIFSFSYMNMKSIKHILCIPEA